AAGARHAPCAAGADHRRPTALRLPRHAQAPLPPARGPDAGLTGCRRGFPGASAGRLPHARSANGHAGRLSGLAPDGTLAARAGLGRSLREDLASPGRTAFGPGTGPAPADGPDATTRRAAESLGLPVGAGRVPLSLLTHWPA